MLSPSDGVDVGAGVVVDDGAVSLIFGVLVESSQAANIVIINKTGIMKKLFFTGTLLQSWLDSKVSTISKCQ
jgi:hypothetical protein